MTDKKEPKDLSDDQLDKVQGGMGNFEIQRGFTGKGRSAQDVIATGNQTPLATPTTTKDGS